eukprot:c54783_g1_i1 orf=33-251(-)
MLITTIPPGLFYTPNISFTQSYFAMLSGCPRTGERDGVDGGNEETACKMNFRPLLIPGDDIPLFAMSLKPRQ